MSTLISVSYFGVKLLCFYKNCIILYVTSSLDSMKKKNEKTSSTTNFEMDEVEKRSNNNSSSSRHYLPPIKNSELSANLNVDEVQQSKAQWENQIAKHILSLFASTQILEKGSESKSLQEFVYGDEQVNGDVGNEETLNNNAIVLSKIDKPKKKLKVKDKKPRSSNVKESDDSRKADIQMVKGLQRRILEEEENNEYGNKYRVTTIIKSKTGDDIVVRGQPKCYPIWFVSSGEVYSDWSGLPGGKRLQAQLSNLYENAQYVEYLGVIEKILIYQWREVLYGESGNELSKEPQFGISAEYGDGKLRVQSSPNKFGDSKAKEKKAKNLSENHPNFGSMLSWTADGQVHVTSSANKTITTQQTSTKAKEHSSRVIAKDGFLKSDTDGAKLTAASLTEYWKLLVLTANAKGVLAVERRNYELAMDVFRLAEKWAANDEFLPDKWARRELGAHVADAMAYFFFKKGKALAAMSYSTNAMEAYELCGNIDGIGTCLLHIAAAYSLLGKHKTAHKKLFEFLAMIETGRLATADSTPKQLCLAAIGYHNLAVVQLKLQLPDLACKNSQNARRLARLCLSYSNRYIHVFQYTHEIAIADIKWELARQKAEELTSEQLKFIKDLSESFFATAEGETDDS